VSFASPLLLLTLLVPLVALGAYVWGERRSTKYVVPFPNLAVLASVATRSSSWRRHAVAAAVLGSVALLCVSAARPKVSVAATQDRATVILVLDVSGSMAAEDVKPTRIEAARAAMRRFLDRLPKSVRVGVVAFSNAAEVVVVPTTDRDRVREGLDVLLPQYGTAIGDAVARSAELAHSATVEAGGSTTPPKKGEPAPSAVVFLSDGFQTQGVLTPEQGAATARRLRVPVYTVSLGTDSGVIQVVRFGEVRSIPVPPDRETLARIAETTGGESFDVRSEGKLRKVYESLGTRLGRTQKRQEITVAFVAAGAALLAAAGLLGALWQPRLP
jgi:Ca-activated chloride channel family protein